MRFYALERESSNDRKENKIQKLLNFQFCSRNACRILNFVVQSQMLSKIQIFKTILRVSNRVSACFKTPKKVPQRAIILTSCVTVINNKTYHFSLILDCSSGSFVDQLEADPKILSGNHLPSTLFVLVCPGSRP